MYAFVEGTLETHTASAVILNVRGLGFEVFFPASQVGKLPALGKSLRLYTSFVIRENSQALYGFLTRNEKELFEVLLGVSGVGPKTALAVIGHLSYTELQKAVTNGDTKAICRVPGIGKKTAERLILEIRDKIHGMVPHMATQNGGADLSSAHTQKLRDAVAALVNLGYTQQQAHRAVSQTVESIEEKDLELGLLITQALQNVKL